MKKKLMLLIAGYLGTFLSIRIFPIDHANVSNYLAELIFSPFALLGSVIFFIGGFLAYSSLLKDIIEKGYKVSKKTAFFNGKEKLIIVGLIVSYSILFFVHLWVTLVSLILAIYYSVMDLKDKQYYDQRLRK